MATERKRTESHRVLRILAIVWEHGPITQREIADKIKPTHDTCRANLYVDLDVLEIAGFVTITKDKETRYIAAKRPFPHRGGVDVFLSKPFPG